MRQRQLWSQNRKHRSRQAERPFFYEEKIVYAKSELKRIRSEDDVGREGDGGWFVMVVRCLE